MSLSRRSLISSVALGAAGLVLMSGCVTNKDGTTTTHTLDVVKIKNYAQAGINAAATIASVLAFIPALEKFTDPIQALSSKLIADLETFSRETEGKISISYDEYNWKVLVDSILLDLDQLFFTIETLVAGSVTIPGGVSEEILKKITLVRDALRTVISIYKTIVGGFFATNSSGASPMSEAEALEILGIRI